MNAYLEHVRELGVEQGGDPMQQLVEQMRKLRANDYNPLMMRDAQVRRWAWAVPNDEALDAIAALSPIVEVGAGGGYWAKLLRDRGATVDCYDATPYPLFNHYVVRSYVAVAKGPSARCATIPTARCSCAGPATPTRGRPGRWSCTAASTSPTSARERAAAPPTTTSTAYLTSCTSRRRPSRSRSGRACTTG